MHSAKLFKLLTIVVVLVLAISGMAQNIRFENFPDTKNLTLNGANGAMPHLATWNGLQVLRLTDGQSNTNSVQDAPATSVWFSIPQPLPSGFTTYFKFVIHNPLQYHNQGLPGDGLAFVIQNAPNTDASLCASGVQGTALSAAPGGLGYTGIPNSIAIEFDTRQDTWDPNANHVAMQSCGTKPNTPVHDSGTYTICSNNQVTSCLYNGAISTAIPPLGVACGNGGCIDGIPVTVVVDYTGNSQIDAHHLRVYVDPPLIPGTHTPAAGATAQIDVPGFTIENQIRIAQTVNSSALVGFTASQASESQTTDLIAWEFTPHAPTQITETINSGGTENQFNFGDHLYGVTYPMDFNNSNGDLMTVNAMPIGQQDFYITRLQNTSFNNEQCVRYYGTGNSSGSDGSIGPSCIVYEVTCQCGPHNNSCMQGQNIACPNPSENELIDTLTSYSTPDPINAGNADYIKTPIGTNNWCSIFTSFMQNDIDPTTSGSGKDFSDFVATFKTAPGTDPVCPGSGNANSRLKKLPQTNAAAPTRNAQSEAAPAGGNK